MLDVELLEEINRLGHKISIEAIQVVVKERGEVFWQIIGLLKARAEAISQGCDIRHMLVLTDLGLFFDVSLKLSITIATEQPLEDGFLHLLVILLLKEIIVEKFHGGHDK